MSPNSGVFRRPDLPVMSQEEYLLLNEVISQQFGIWFPEHKREILESRLRPRLQALHLKRFMDYYLLMQVDLRGEVEQLARLVTNNETYFFRETHQFEALFGEALEGLKASSPVPFELRLLCAGCSSGEEPHTLNIFARENGYRLGGTVVQVDAFDIDTSRLAAARSGVYGSTSMRSVDEEQVRRYFNLQDGGHLLKPMYRKGVGFATGNIIDLATYRRALAYDAVFCRNVLIYFSEPALHQAIDNFAAVLRPGGLLFLGHAESIIGLSPHFETVRLQHCIAYRRTGAAAPPPRRAASDRVSV